MAGVKELPPSLTSNCRRKSRLSSPLRHPKQSLRREGERRRHASRRLRGAADRRERPGGLSKVNLLADELPKNPGAGSAAVSAKEKEAGKPRCPGKRVRPLEERAARALIKVKSIRVSPSLAFRACSNTGNALILDTFQHSNQKCIGPSAEMAWLRFCCIFGRRKSD